jgi:hypothetical protein
MCRTSICVWCQSSFFYHWIPDPDQNPHCSAILDPDTVKQAKITNFPLSLIPNFSKMFLVPMLGCFERTYKIYFYLVIR